MPNIVVVGAQWGDEGKGKIVDLLTEKVQVVARFNGGHNAGHTIQVGKESFVLHLIPAGILHPGILCVMGNGMVIDPWALEKEMGELTARGVSIEDNLVISDRAHLILPHHRALEAMAEEARGRAQDRHHPARHRPRLRGQGGAARPAHGRPAAARGHAGQARGGAALLRGGLPDPRARSRRWTGTRSCATSPASASGCGRASRTPRS